MVFQEVVPGFNENKKYKFKRRTNETVERDPPAAPRKAKADVEIGPPAARTESLWKVGPHVSVSGGLETSVLRAAAVGSVVLSRSQM